MSYNLREGVDARSDGSSKSSGWTPDPATLHRLNTDRFLREQDDLEYDLTAQCADLEAKTVEASDGGHDDEAALYWDQLKTCRASLSDVRVSKVRAQTAATDVRVQNMRAAQLQLQVSAHAARVSSAQGVDLDTMQRLAEDDQMARAEQQEKDKTLRAMQATGDRANRAGRAAGAAGAVPPDMAEFLATKKHDGRLSTAGAVPSQPLWKQQLDAAREKDKQRAAAVAAVKKKTAEESKQ
jgi:hypothetical protein